MRVGKLRACSALVVILGGCNHVASTHPVGGAPLRLEEGEWAGSWLHSDGSLVVRVADAEKGLLEVAWAEERDGEFVLESVDVYLRQFEDWTFASFAGVEDEESDLLWSRLGRDREQIFLWWPRPEEFKRLVEAGLLPGTVEDGDVLLERLETEHLAIIASEEHGVLFEWDEPMTFNRLK